MTNYTDLIQDVDDTVSSGLFENLNIAEPVADMLPHRGKPYELETPTENPLFRFINPVSETSNVITDAEIKVIAEQETDWLIFQLEIFGGVFKGIFSELIISDEDLSKLRMYQAGSVFDPEEIADIIRREDIKRKFELSKSSDRSKQREFLQKVVANELRKKREQGHLQFPNSANFMMKMLLTEMVTATMGDYSVLKTVGKNAFIKAKNIF